ncbi:hypothetical protein [Baekduia sp. Peel2402]|uniref:hypothetical protein n=1 Tax=Baekduia sp. Peel2402 TaxID=3458296 RepID=UPI00403E6136
MTAMNAAQVDRLVESVKEPIEPRSRRRLEGYANAARRCDARIGELRARVEASILAAGDDPRSADAVLDAMIELDALERIQLRIDAGLRASVGALSEQDLPSPVGEGPV